MELVFLIISILSFMFAAGLIGKAIYKLKELKKAKRNGVWLDGKIIDIVPFVEDTEISNLIKIQYKYKDQYRILEENVGGTRFLWEKGERVELIVHQDLVLINDLRYIFVHYITGIIGLGLLVLGFIMLLKGI